MSLKNNDHIRMCLCQLDRNSNKQDILLSDIYQQNMWTIVSRYLFREGLPPLRRPASTFIYLSPLFSAVLSWYVINFVIHINKTTIVRCWPPSSWARRLCWRAPSCCLQREERDLHFPFTCHDFRGRGWGFTPQLPIITPLLKPSGPPIGPVKQSKHTNITSSLICPTEASRRYLWIYNLPSDT